MVNFFKVLFDSFLSLLSAVPEAIRKTEVFWYFVAFTLIFLVIISSVFLHFFA